MRGPNGIAPFAATIFEVRRVFGGGGNGRVKADHPTRQSTISFGHWRFKNPVLMCPALLLRLLEVPAFNVVGASANAGASMGGVSHLAARLLL